MMNQCIIKVKEAFKNLNKWASKDVDLYKIFIFLFIFTIYIYLSQIYIKINLPTFAPSISKAKANFALLYAE